MPCNPDLPWGQIEGREVRCNTAAQKALQPMMDNLSADIDHLFGVRRVKWPDHGMSNMPEYTEGRDPPPTSRPADKRSRML